jgi:hypothetical protein
MMQNLMAAHFEGLADEVAAFRKVFGVQQEEIERPEDQQKLLAVLEAARRQRGGK